MGDDKVLDGTWGDGSPRRYIQCSLCARTQTIKPIDKPGGITPDEAVAIGWQFDGVEWTCPMRHEN